MNEKKDRTNLIAGIFVLCGIALLAGLIVQFGPLRHMMRRPYRIYATFTDAQNLISGAPVRRAGAIIGKVVSAPELVGMKGVRVSLDIYPEYQIARSSPLTVSTISLMGDSALDVGVPATPGDTAYLAEGDTMQGSGSQDLTTAASRLTDEAVAVMKDIRSSLTEINDTLSRVKLGLLSDENIKNVSTSMSRLNASMEKVDDVILSAANTSALKDSLAALQKTTATLSGATERVGGVLDKADSAMAKLDKAMDSAGPGLKGFQAATASLTRAADSLEELMKLAKSGRGILGLVLNDPVVAQNFARLVYNLRTRGVLWYKDKEPPAPTQPANPPRNRR